jgi:hypothetical protein
MIIAEKKHDGMHVNTATWYIGLRTLLYVCTFVKTLRGVNRDTCWKAWKRVQKRCGTRLEEVWPYRDVIRVYVQGKVEIDDNITYLLLTECWAHVPYEGNIEPQDTR